MTTNNLTVESLRRQYKHRLIWIFAAHLPLCLGLVYADSVFSSDANVILRAQIAVLGQINESLAQVMRLEAIPFNKQTAEQTASARSLRVKISVLNAQQAALQVEYQRRVAVRYWISPTIAILFCTSWDHAPSPGAIFEKPPTDLPKANASIAVTTSAAVPTAAET